MSRRAGRVTYLLHFIDRQTGRAARYKHAGHYLGDSEAGREGERLEEHRAGRGSVLTAAARQAGLDFVITRTWQGGAEKARQLKTRSGALYCPECSPHPEPGTRPRRPGAKYLTRRQREEAARQREEAARQREAAPASPAPAPGPAWRRDPAPAYQLEDWPQLTSRLSLREAAELTYQLREGAQAAYHAAEQAWSTDEHTARFDTATEVDMASTKAARETTEIHGRDPAEPVHDWITRTRPAEQAGAETASQIVTAQAEAGMDPGRIGAHHEDLTAGLLSDATTADGQAFGRAYDDTAATLAADLRREADRGPAAASLPDGTPHADAFLAGRGWHVDRGMYTRRQPTEHSYRDQLTALADRQAVPEIDREAG